MEPVNIRSLPRMLFDEFGNNHRLTERMMADGENDTILSIAQTDEYLQNFTLYVWRNQSYFDNGIDGHALPELMISAGVFWSGEDRSVLSEQAQISLPQHYTDLSVTGRKWLATVGRILARAAELVNEPDRFVPLGRASIFSPEEILAISQH